MTRTPRLKSQLRVLVPQPDRIVILSESGEHVLEGKVFRLLTPLLNGAMSIPDIVQTLNGEVRPGDVLAALALLDAAGHLADTPALPAGEKDEENEGDTDGILARDHDVDRDALPEHLRRVQVAVSVHGAVDRDAIATTLKSIDVNVSDEGTIGLAIADHYLRSELDEEARRALQRGRPWLPVRLDGSSIWVGPAIDPPRTICWTCLVARLRVNHPWRAWAEDHRCRTGRELVAPLAVTDGALELAVRAAAMQLVRWLASKNPARSDTTLVDIDGDSRKVSRHVVVGQPHCPRCGSPGSGAAVTSRGLASSSNTSIIRSTDGGWRTAAPEETFDAYRHHVSPLCGIVQRLTACEQRFGPPFTVVAEHRFPVAIDREDSHEGGPKVRHSLGRGATEVQAQTSALCEALERYSGVFRGDELHIRATRAALGECAIAPNTCMHFSERQIRSRDDAGPAASIERWIPVPLGDDEEIDWTPVRRLSDGSARYVPAAYCYYGYRPAADRRFCRADSNGTAAGNTQEEAILQGFMELVERDAAAIWWYNRLSRPGIDLESFSSPSLKAIRRTFAAMDRDLHVLDLSNDLQIPAFVAVATSRRVRSGIALGFGAHFDADVAIARALAEVHQWMSLSDSGIHRMPVLSVGGEAFVSPAPVPFRRRDDFPVSCHADVIQAVGDCVRIAAARGLDVLVLDQTRRDVGLPVVKVIVPGLRHYWPRLGSGRLYSVPVTLGWQAIPLNESDCNPVELFL